MYKFSIFTREYNNMKKVFLSAITFLGLFSLTFLTSCTPDPCEQVNCAYSGVCENGACLCQTGYEGVHCEVIMRDKFKGIYVVNEDGTLSGINQYATSVENGDQINQVRIKNFKNIVQQDVIATVNADTLTIAYQQLDSDTYAVEGWATIKDINPLSQHYYQQAVMNFYYKFTNLTNNEVDEFGSNGSAPSNWAKD